MKKLVYFLIALFLFSSCAEKTNFTLTGKLAGGEGKTVYFSKLLPGGLAPTDSCKLDKGGNFSFKGKTSSPSFYLLSLNNKTFTTLLLDSAEHAIIDGTYANFLSDYRIKGSVGSEKLRELDNLLAEAKKEVNSLNRQIKQAGGNQVVIAQLQAKCNTIMNDHSNYVTSFVRRNPFSLASVFALYQKWDDNNYVVNDLQTMKTAASALHSVYPHNEQVAALYNNTLQLMKAENNKKLSSIMAQNAVNSPDVSLPDVNGVTKHLWSLRGKYVLLYFWASKDKSSRVVNQMLSELYTKYRNKGFELYMVSVDDKKEEWIKAIGEDGLNNAIHVSDLKGCSQAITAYNIQTIPADYLLDKEGNIVGKDLFGPQLTQTLAKVLK